MICSFGGKFFFENSTFVKNQLIWALFQQLKSRISWNWLIFIWFFFIFQLVLSCLVNLAFSATVQVPAGINPADCPGYPNCPFYLLTNNRPANQPADTVYELCPGYPICDNVALHNAAGPALSAPAGVDISKCPGYPFQQCNW